MVLGVICLIIKPAFPTTIKELINIVSAGSLIVSAFSLGVFITIDQGISAATSALIISFQPLLASLIANLFFKTKISMV